jgi:hypothetical protein
VAHSASSGGLHGIGLGLAAPCGFRVFVPLLVLSLAAKSGYVPLTPGWAWIGTAPAALAFGVATLFEVFGYFIPWVDHVLDVAAPPAAVVAGTVTTASVLTDLPPLVRWAAIITGGGGLAALVQSSTVALRAPVDSHDGSRIPTPRLAGCPSPRIEKRPRRRLRHADQTPSPNPSR